MNKQNKYINEAAVTENRYDFRNEERDAYRIAKGLTPEIITEISQKKNEPQWMRDFRLRCLDIYYSLDVPPWGPSIEGLDIDNIVTYVKPHTAMQGKWQDVPEDIKDTFEKLGIPQAEQKSLAGVGAQYDSEVVYHNLKEEVARLGVIYTDIETALQGPFEPMIRQHFMQLVTPRDHKFAALHGAVWSGGSFVYVPPGVKVDIPLQSYFRLNAAGAGQFEHTLIIVDKGADLHFIEGCSAPKYNVANLHAGCIGRQLLVVGFLEHFVHATHEIVHLRGIDIHAGGYVTLQPRCLGHAHVKAEILERNRVGRSRHGGSLPCHLHACRFCVVIVLRCGRDA